jgi:hypothetical protein
MHNQMIERELKALKDGSRKGEGENGLLHLQEFEQLLQAIPVEELKVINPDKAKQLAAGK